MFRERRRRINIEKNNAPQFTNKKEELLYSLNKLKKTEEVLNVVINNRIQSYQELKSEQEIRLFRKPNSTVNFDNTSGCQDLSTGEKTTVEWLNSQFAFDLRDKIKAIGVLNNLREEIKHERIMKKIQLDKFVYNHPSE